MNKLFTKVATLCVGLAMAAGVGVAVGASSVGEVKATEAEAYKLDGMVQATGTNYAGDNEVVQSGVTWIVNGNVNQTPWRLGGKKSNGLDVAGTVRKVQSQGTVTSLEVKKVVVTTSLPGSSSAISPTSVSLKVGTEKGASDISTVSGTFGNSIVFECPSNTDWSSRYFEVDFTMPQNNTDTQKYFLLSSVVFYYESSTPRGTLEITNVPHIVKVGDKFTPSYNWEPAQGSSSTIVTSSVTYEVSDSEVFTKDGSTFTAAKAGFATVTLTATDSVSEEYVSVSHKVFVTNPYNFSVGDSVALCAPDAKQELSSISDGNTPYGVGAEYSENPAGTFELEVQEGSLGGSFAFRNEAGFLSWSAGNSLKVEDGKTENSAWYVVVYDSYMVIKNCADDTREIWWNAGTPRFACYTNKTPETSGYNSVDLYILGGQPVEVKYEVSFYEGTTGSSSEYAEGAKVTIPQPTESLIPEGKAFDYWEHKETGNHYAPGEEFTVGTSNARFDAVYKDVEPVVTDWDPTLKTQFENELDGFVPPFVAAFSEAIEVYDGQNNAYGFVAENVVSDITSAFVNAEYGEPTEDEGAYSYSIPTANGTVQIEYAYSEGQSVGTYFYLIYVESITGEWSPEQQTQMTENVGLVLPYLGDDFAAALTLNDTDPEDVYFEGEVEGNKIMSIYNAFGSAQWDYFWMSPETYNYFFTNPTGTGTAVFQCGAYQASATEIKTFFYYYFSDYRGIVELHESIDAYVGDSISDLELSLALVNTEMMGSLIDAANCEFSVTSFDTAGEVEVDVYYNYFYGSFTVNVIEVEATGLSLDASKVKSSYEIGDEFDPAGLEIKLNFNNGSSQDLSLDDVEISGFDSEVAGEKTITVKYGDFTQTFTVTVNEHVPVLESIQVTKNPDKVEYEVGEAFDSTGIEVSAIYDVGDPVVVDLKDVSFSGFDSATVGEKTVTVSYGNFSTTIKVTVKKAAYTAEQFAEDFLAEIEKVCKGYDGKKNNKTALNNVWTKMSARYNELSSDEKTKIANATPKADGDAIQRMLTFYNYACKKYGLTKFISTQKSSLVINSTETTNNNLPIIVIVASAIAAVTAIGVVIGLKRRKNLLVK